MSYLGDFAEDSTIRIALTTNNTSGAAVAPSSAFEADDFRIYKNGSATQKTTTNGITIASPFDSVTGLHSLEIDTSNDTGDSGFWTTGADYWVVAVPDETVASQTVVDVVAVFSIENRLRVKSTDQVSLAANATCTKFTDIETDTQDIQTRLPAALVSGRIDSSVGAYQSGLAPPTAAENGAAGWNLMLVDHTSTGSFGAAVGALPLAPAIADAVWDEPYASHNIAGSFGKLLNTIRKSNLAIEGTVSNAITPTTLTFSSNVSATTSAYAHAVLLFVSGPLTGENSPIISYNNTNGVFVLEEPLTAAPSDGDEFVVIAGNHVHAIADIQSGLATSNGVTAAFTEIKGAGWNSATDTLEKISDAIAGISSGTGTGARTVTVTVNDGTTVLQNARVRLTEGANTYTGLTNASGVVTFNVDDATYVVSITKAGYTYAGTTLVVDGTETRTYSMTLVSLTASDVDKVTGYWTVLDAQGSEASGVVVTVKARQASRGSAGALHNSATRTATSAANGLVQFPNMIPGWRYSVVANDEYVADFTVPADAVTSVELGSIVARLT